MDGWMDGWTDGWMDGWTDGRMDGWMDGRMDGWMVGWMDRHRMEATLCSAYISELACQNPSICLSNSLTKEVEGSRDFLDLIETVTSR
jgi:hypothetical protein